MTFVFGACAPLGSGGGGGGRVVPTDKPSCELQADDGELAVMSNLNRDDVIASDFFAKKYDRADLEAVGKASIRETIAYGQGLGLTLHRVPRKSDKVPKSAGNKCPLYQLLTVAGGDLQKIWNQEAGGDLGGGSLAGLYFENCRGRNCKGHAPVNPTILIDEWQDRWTLVHEMMHHNFNKERKRDTALASIDDLRRALDASLKRFDKLNKDYQAMPNRADLIEAAKELDKAVHLVTEVLVRSVFEELAVEGVLINTWADGRLTYVSRASAENAAWYMSYARSQGLGRFQGLDEIFKVYKDEADKYFWTEITAQVTATQAFIGDLSRQTADMIERASQAVGGPPVIPGHMLMSDRLASITKAYVELNGHPHSDALEAAEALKVFDEHIW
jgi:hypothetical protein